MALLVTAATVVTPASPAFLLSCGFRITRVLHTQLSVPLRPALWRDLRSALPRHRGPMPSRECATAKQQSREHGEEGSEYDRCHAISCDQRFHGWNHLERCPSPREESMKMEGSFP